MPAHSVFVPDGGFPVWFSFVVDQYVVENKTCGPGGGYGGGGYSAFATPNDALKKCYNTSEHGAPPLTNSTCAFNKTTGKCFEASQFSKPKILPGLDLDKCCSEATSSGDRDFTFYPNGTCALYKFASRHMVDCDPKTISGARGGHPPHGGGCSYEQQAGGLWDQRFKQILLANGVAVVQVNPYKRDNWDLGESLWDSGEDKAYLTGLFAMLEKGDLGPLDPTKVALRGWSGGAQMVSWLFQVIATTPTTFPGVTIKAGVMLSGGSYQCYNDPKQATGASNTPVGSCTTCTEGGPSHCENDPLCNSCNVSVKTYCQQCCPRNYTEQYYQDHPDKYASHPPTFLLQMSSVDNHADLCACKHYADALTAHGVSNKLVLVPTTDESCFCVGTPTEPAAAGSPFSPACKHPDWGKQCSTMGGKDCCISHTMGAAVMLDPLMGFLKDVFA
jgi:hypothetical protein